MCDTNGSTWDWESMSKCGEGRRNESKYERWKEREKKIRKCELWGRYRERDSKEKGKIVVQKKEIRQCKKTERLGEKDRNGEGEDRDRERDRGGGEQKRERTEMEIDL